MTYSVYIPHHSLGIDEGSGVVGHDTGGDRILVDFEGNRFGASNIITFADRVYHAASRQEHDYPTIARKFVPRELLVEIGWFDGDRVQVPPGNEDALATWLGTHTLDLTQLARRGR